MATAAQVTANRANAQKSTRPRTPEGKAKVAQSAVKHGLLARAMVLQGEDPQEFAEYREQMLDELYPDGMLEEVLAERIVSLSWRLQRAARSQNAAFEALYDKYAAGGQTEPPAEEGSTGLDPVEPADNGALVGRMLVEDFGQEKVLERLLMYERRIESSLYRTMAELRKLRGQWGSTGGGRRGVPGLRSEVPREQYRASPPPASDFTLDNLLSALAALEETPDGVTTNARADSVCETKPISEEVSGEDRRLKCEVSRLKLESPGAGSPGLPAPNFTLQTSDEPPAAIAMNGTGTGGQSCETKPISAEGEERAVPCGAGV